jgi:hypothetical protein
MLQSSDLLDRLHCRKANRTTKGLEQGIRRKDCDVRVGATQNGFHLVYVASASSVGDLPTNLDAVRAGLHSAIEVKGFSCLITGSAKPLCVGSIPTRASKLFPVVACQPYRLGSQFGPSSGHSSPSLCS